MSSQTSAAVAPKYVKLPECLNCVFYMHRSSRRTCMLEGTTVNIGVEKQFFSLGTSETRCCNSRAKNRESGEMVTKHVRVQM